MNHRYPDESIRKSTTLYPEILPARGRFGRGETNISTGTFELDELDRLVPLTEGDIANLQSNKIDEPLRQKIRQRISVARLLKGAS